PDLVITTSETLCQARRRFNPHTRWVPNAADIAHFSTPATPPAELQQIPRPIVGFVGGLSQWVDVELIAALAAARRDWSFVLVGPVGTDISALGNLDNLMLLGSRPYQNLPAYLAAMDGGRSPFNQ